MTQRLQIASAALDLRDPENGQLDRQFLMGEEVELLDGPQGRSVFSGHKGILDPEDLRPWTRPNAVISRPMSLLFEDDNFKSPNPERLSMGSLLSIVNDTERFFETDEHRFVPKDHVTFLERGVGDPLACISALCGVPYLWGGNTAWGLDCSGLVQMWMRLMQMPCPGDSGPQSQTLGEEIAIDAKVQKGDLWFWKGHVAISWDAGTLIHANAHHMCVAFEPLNDALMRIAAQGDGPVTGRRRVL